MNLYHVTQRHVYGYDTYSDMVVAAPDELTARQTHPSAAWETRVTSDGDFEMHRDYVRPGQTEWFRASNHSWPNNIRHVTAQLIGQAAPDVKAGVICASFHAG